MPNNNHGKERNRKLVWFSCGAASTVCAYIYRNDPSAVFVYCDTGGEHPDNKRYLKDVEKAFSIQVTILKRKTYSDHMDVCEKTGYLNGPMGARCTVELKKKLRFRFQEPGDIQIFGYTHEEKHRASRFDEAFPEANAEYPLIERGLIKQQCVAMVEQFGIDVPAMYKLGFNNNNCIGCVKGKCGYWNKIRQHFPEQFKRMARIERAVKHTCISGTYLDELDPEKGRKLKEPDMTCDFICQSVLMDLE